MKQGDLASKVGVSQSRLSQWENGDHDPKDNEVLKKLADALETTYEHLKDGVPHTPREPKAEPTGKIKVYGSISAGDGETQHADEFDIDVPAAMAREDFRGLVVEGKSMEPFLYHGDVAIFKVYDGDRTNITRAIELPDGRWTMKFVAKVDGGIKPIPANPEYPVIEGEFRLAGYLVGFVRDVGLEREMRLNPGGLQPKPHEMGELARFLKI